MSQQLVVEIIPNQHKTSTRDEHPCLSLIRTRDPINLQVTADLSVRPHGQWNWLYFNLKFF
jgi:hypothetical protein